MTGSSIDPLAALRVLCGLWFLPHCIGKMRNVSAAAKNTFSRAGFPRPRVLVLVTIVLELLAGAGLVLGIHERVAAALAVIVLMGAAVAVIRISGWQWRWQNLGPEYMLFWAIATVLSVWRQT